MVETASGTAGSEQQDVGKTKPTAITEGREMFKAGAGRTISFSLIFLILLPFFVSLGPMLFWRVSQGHWNGTVGLMILAVAFAAVIYLILVELIFSIRSRVVFGEKTVRVGLPQGRGIMAPFSYVVRDIPYDDIAAIEMRREVYGGSLAPVMMKGARICLKDGSHYKLGYVNEANVDPCLPFAEIGEKIAARAGVEIIDAGDVRRSAVKKFLGLVAAGNEVNPIAPAEIAALNARHNMLMTVLIGTMVLLVGLGIAFDRDTGFRYANVLAGFWTAPAPAVTTDAKQQPAKNNGR